MGDAGNELKILDTKKNQMQVSVTTARFLDGSGRVQSPDGLHVSGSAQMSTHILAESFKLKNDE